MTTTHTSRIHAALSVVAPTVTGLLVYLFLSGITLVAHNIPALQQYLTIPANWQYGRFLLTVLNDLLLHLFGSSLTDTIVLSVFWAIVGLGTYAMLRGAASFIKELGHDISVEKYVQPIGGNRREELRRFLVRSLFRAIILIFTILYVNRVLAVFWRGTVTSTSGFLGILHGSVLARDAALFVGECLAWHGLTILLRLLLLRHRLVE